MACVVASLASQSLRPEEDGCRNYELMFKLAFSELSLFCGVSRYCDAFYTANTPVHTQKVTKTHQKGQKRVNFTRYALFSTIDHGV